MLRAYSSSVLSPNITTFLKADAFLIHLFIALLIPRVVRITFAEDFISKGSKLVFHPEEIPSNNFRFFKRGLRARKFATLETFTIKWNAQTNQKRMKISKRFTSMYTNYATCIQFDVCVLHFSWLVKKEKTFHVKSSSQSFVTWLLLKIKTRKLSYEKCFFIKIKI